MALVVVGLFFWLVSAYLGAAVPGLWQKEHTLCIGFLVDLVGKRGYNTYMNTEKQTRKKRTDRNHIIYELVVPSGNYIGVTAKTETTVLKSVRARAAKHFYRAKTEGKDWTLCIALRELASKDLIEIRIHAIIRGKAEAHRAEVQIRRAVKPNLNTDTRGD